MDKKNNLWALILGVCIIIGFSSLGYLGGKSAVKIKEYERVVTVKGLSEKDYLADTVLMPIEYITNSNDLESLYDSLKESENKVRKFLINKGIEDKEISVSNIEIEDRSRYTNGEKLDYIYLGTQKITVYTKKVEKINNIKKELQELLKEGVYLSGNQYTTPIEYIFTGLNEVKPKMIEEATKNARLVAEKFAKDSDSSVGKIKSATQGQFSIYGRDSGNPQIKRVRVVSTVQYYLVD
ncbi:MAG: SIMPL domain-containing protein [Fusobacterium sp.]